MEGPTLRHNPSRTAPPSWRTEERDAFLGQAVEPLPWRLLGGGRSLQPALPCALVLSALRGPAALGRTQTSLSPHTLGNNGLQPPEGKGLPLPTRQGNRAVGDGRSERGELTVLVVGAPVESLGEVCREVAEVCWMERAFLTSSTLLVLPWRPSGALTCTSGCSRCCLNKRNRNQSPPLPLASLSGL